MKHLFYTILITLTALNTAAQIQPTRKLSINEQTYVNLNGEQQYVEMTGTSPDNPVLLFLHGGPGWPQTPYLRYFNADLTNTVTLVSWDQAGCGKSALLNPAPKDLTLERLIKDAHELTRVLKNRFHKKQIYLAGFSWGSIIGLELAKQYPEDYIAYFGISQVIDMNQSIDLSREWLKQQATVKGDKTMLNKVAQLEQHDPALCKNPMECFLKKYEMLTEYGGAIHTPEAEAQIKTAETQFDDYKNYDWTKGFIYSCSHLGDAIFETNLSRISKLEVPAYFFVGRHDHSLPPQVTEDYVNKLKAPKKELIWFENSGHEPLEEEPANFNKAIADRIVR
jgi:proline iminopeptidase